MGRGAENGSPEPQGTVTERPRGWRAEVRAVSEGRALRKPTLTPHSQGSEHQRPVLRPLCHSSFPPGPEPRSGTYWDILFFLLIDLMWLSYSGQPFKYKPI